MQSFWAYSGIDLSGMALRSGIISPEYFELEY